MLLELTNISKSFGSLEHGQLNTVLNGISLKLEKGKSIAIVGPSGSGKSTLLNIIGTLEYPDSGTVEFDQTSLSTLSEKKLSAFRNTALGFIFQSHHLLPQCNVLENVLLPTLALKEKKGALYLVRANELIKAVGLWEQRHQFPSTLSGGECQRVAVIRALINQPKLLLADEPTGSLDHGNAQSVADLLVSLQKQHQTALLVVTHSSEIAAKMDAQYELKDGKLSELIDRK